MAEDNDAELVALGRQLCAFEQGWAAYHEDGTAGDREELRLRAWGVELFAAIATRPAGLDLKMRAIDLCNTIGGLTPADRVAQAGNRADALAWAIVADLMAERGQP